MRRKAAQWFAIALTTAVLVVLSPVVPIYQSSLPLGVNRAIAQDFGRASAQQWQQVYEQVPDLPLENHYVSTVTGEVAADNTLAGRLIQYHVYVKSRPPSYRLDWKLTLADYLGVNDWMIEANYPGATTLQPHPMAGDIAAIGQLNRAQRDALVTALVGVFTQPEAPASSPPPAPPAGTAPTQPGAADLLLP